MGIAKRIVFFIATNLLVILTISIALQVLGVRPYLTAYGIDYQQLFYFCLVWGMGGAFISLAMSRIAAKFMAGVHVLDPQTRDSREAELVATVHRLAQAAGIHRMPEVGVYDSPEPNAFATGPTKNRALVAVSTGLMSRMDRNQLEGVLGHEIAHIANGDMVTMTLLQGIVNAFVMFFARVIAFAISQNVKEESRHTVRWITTFALEILLSFLGAIVVAYFSRRREFRADAGGARLAGRDNMVKALQGLQRIYSPELAQDQPALATLKISGKSGGLMALFSTHPPIETRILALEHAAI